MRKEGVHSVHTALGFGFSCTSLGLGRIGDVFGGKGGFAGGGVRFESHLGHVFSLFRGLWAAERGQTVHMRAPSGAFFVGNRVVGPAHSLPARSTVWCLLPFRCRLGRGQHDLLKR